MVNREEILCMEFLKKTEFTGSTEGMRYRMEKVMKKGTNDAGEEYSYPELLCTIWPEPFNYVRTPEEKKERKTFSFDDDGVVDAVDWMNNCLFERHDEFAAAASNWDQYVLPEFK